MIWKIYQRGANIEVGKLEKLKDFDLSSPEVKTKLKERYGVGILNGGLGIAVAKNIKFAKTYEAPERKFGDMKLPEDYSGPGAKAHDVI